MIKAVLFDMGDIFFEANLWRKWMYEKIKKFGAFEGNFADFYELYESFLLPVYEGRKTYDRAYDDFLKSIAITEPAGFKEESFKMKKFFEENRELYDGVSETLEYLKKAGINNIVITDNEQGEKAIRETILARFEINDFIDEVISSREFGLTKSDPKFFDLALTLLKLKSGEVLFVGHDKEEIDGAESRGIISVEFNNYLGYANNATYKMKEFKQLKELIFALNYE